jgi:ribonuclease BN (tRNA processing enzyme)
VKHFGIPTSRRSFLKQVAAAPALAGVAVAGMAASTSAVPDTTAGNESLAPEALKNAKGTKLVLLGTCGGPVLGQRRHMTSQILVSNGATYVVDCGMTVTNRIAEAGVPLKSIRGVFITHHHPDHNSEYGPLLLMSWMWGLRGEINTYGPPPLSEMTRDYLRSIQWSVDLWIKDVKIEPFPNVNAHDLATPGHVMEDENVRVRSTLVQHPPIVPAYAYRFDFKDRSFVFSGDTVPLEAMAQLAHGADVLVHEAMYEPIIPTLVKELAAQRGLTGPQWPQIMTDHMMRDHSPVEEVGRLAQEAGVGTLVLSHLTPGANTPAVSDDEWRARAALHFKGKIVVGHDLMVI